MLYAFITISVFATAIMSGILGMAGGMVLMAILVTALSVANAMLLHGAVQATSNGSRAWFLRTHILWHILPLYVAGAALSVGLFTALALVPEPGLVLILVGIFPWVALLTPRLQGLDVTHKPTTVICGFVVTSAQLIAGASGPLLDVFYVNSPLTRQQIVASKAVTQAFGHVLKMIYYGFIIAMSSNLPAWLFAVAIAAAVLGSRVGTRLLERWNDASFSKYSRAIILTIAAYCIAQGLWSLLA
jgi:uncharacterized membrane protein YfcA